MSNPVYVGLLHRAAVTRPGAAPGLRYPRAWHFIFALSVVLATVAGRADAKGRKLGPQPCPDGRFLLDSPLPGASIGGGVEIVLAKRTISILGVCAPVNSVLRVTSRGTRVAARWQRCAGIDGVVRLKGIIDSRSCSRFNGFFVGRRSSVTHRHFGALRACDSNAGSRLDVTASPTLADSVQLARELGYTGFPVTCDTNPTGPMFAAIPDSTGRVIGLMGQSGDPKALPSLLLRSNGDRAELFNREGGIAISVAHKKRRRIERIVSPLRDARRGMIGDLASFPPTGEDPTCSEAWVGLLDCISALSAKTENPACPVCAQLIEGCLGLQRPDAVAACLAAVAGGVCLVCLPTAIDACQDVPHLFDPCMPDSACVASAICAFGACVPVTVSSGLDCTRDPGHAPRCDSARGGVASATCDLFGICEDNVFTCTACETCDSQSVRCVPDRTRDGQVCLNGPQPGICCAGVCGQGGQCRCDASQWVGSYSGTYTGSEDGSWRATVNSDATMEVQATSPSCGLFSGIGTISACGSVSVTTVGGGSCSEFSVTWDGTFSSDGATISGSGTWASSSGYSGTWTGGKE
jgi:hypothetical protein